MSLGTIFQSIEILSKEKGHRSADHSGRGQGRHAGGGAQAFPHQRRAGGGHGRKTGAILIFGVKSVVAEVTDPDKEMTLEAARAIQPEAEIGAEIRIPKPTEALGRISAQTAKQVIFQKVREAERETFFRNIRAAWASWSHCVIKRVEGQDLMPDLGKTEAGCRRRSNRAWKASAWATASAASSRAWTRRARTRA